MSRPDNIQPAPYAHGFGIVELMVAMVISMILLAGMLQVYASSKKNYQVQDALARLQQDGRYAMSLLTQDLRMAGYLGGNADVATITGTVASTYICPNSVNWGLMVDQAAFGLNDTLNDGTSNYSACISTYNPGSPQAGAYMGGDIVTIRYASGTPVTAFDANRRYLRTSLFSGKIFPGSQQGANTIVDQPQSTHLLVAHSYYIGYQNTVCNGTATVVPTLYRLSLGSNGAPAQEEVVRGGEQLQAQYGIDSDNDGSVNNYLNADTVTANNLWDNVIAVRLWFLIRSECPEGSYNNGATYTLADVNYTPNDTFRRQLYSATSMLRN